jgi:hypothetical protein
MIDKEPRNCPKCGITCKGKYGLASHTRNCEVGKYPPCPECGHKSTRKDSIENGKRRYYCKNCGKKFFKNTIVYTNCVICGKPLDNIRNQQKYCSQKCDSQAFYQNHKKQINEYQKKWKKENYKRIKERMNIRCITNYHIQIPKGAKCSICGSQKNLQRHHPDYNKPLEVIILCRDCHYDKHWK